MKSKLTALTVLNWWNKPPLKFLVNFNIVNDVVAKVVVNFMTQKMIIEFTEGADIKAVMKTVLKECKKVEPDCEIDL